MILKIRQFENIKDGKVLRSIYNSPMDIQGIGLILTVKK